MYDTILYDEARQTHLEEDMFTQDELDNSYDTGRFGGFIIGLAIGYYIGRVRGLE